MESVRMDLSKLSVVILAGGFGTRFSEETIAKPKPMIEIGGRPILYHIMKQYSLFGLRKFIILTGYKSDIVKEYFLNFAAYNSDFTIKTLDGFLSLESHAEDWEVTILYTGLNSNTGERIRRATDKIGGENPFFLTYGDGLSNIDHQEALDFHLKQKTLVTVTAVKPPGRFGSMQVSNGFVQHWGEKQQGSDGLVSGGYFIIDSKALSHIPSGNASWESDVIPIFVKLNQLSSFLHEGFWQCMDTQRDREHLEAIYRSDSPPWVRID